MGSLSRPLLFRLLAVLVGLSLLGLVEAVLWLVPVPDGDGFVQLSSFTLFSRQHTADGEVVEISHPYAYPERGVRFAVDKPAGQPRIFVLGASAAAGWPHPPEETFSAYLEAMLRTQEGGPVEVINAAAHGFPSYRVRRVFEEVVEFEPDAIVLYCGNNEFLEVRRYGAATVDRLTGWLGRSQLVRRGRSLIPNDGGRLEGDELNDLAASMWARVQRQATSLRDQPLQFGEVQRHYAASISAMLRTAKERDIPVVLLTVPSNLRDWLPTVSSPAPASAAESWQRAFQAGRRHQLLGELDAARDSLGEAVLHAPEHAESWFWLGRAQEALGENELARLAFRRARDEDRNPFRAIGPFQATLRRLAAESTPAGQGSGGVDLVDLERYLDSVSLGAAPGFDLFLDYVHPTVEGNREIARQVGEVLAKRLGLEYDGKGSAASTQAGDVGTPSPAPYHEVNDFDLQMKALGMALVNHQDVAALARARQLRILSVEDSVALPEVVSDVLAVFPLHLQLERSHQLGDPLAAEDLEASREAMTAFYAKWFRFGEF